MRLTRVFMNVSMGYGFQGLTQIAKDAKTKLDYGSTVCFINKKRTAFKLMVNGQYLTYFKNNNRKIPIDTLRLLPEQFGGSQMEFDSAVKKSLQKTLGIKEE